MAGDDELDIPETGAVFTFGRSRFAENVPSHFFIRNDPIVEMACGDEHTAVVCQKGRVFMFGNNDYGQLGLGHRNVITKPSCVKLLKPEIAIHVACGKGHTIVSTESGKVFSWGNNSDGQLGVGDAIDRAVPTQVLDYEGDEIKQISAGCNHTVALTESGRLYVWGSNSDGQLGLEDVHENVLFPRRLEFRQEVTHICCGYYHTAFVTVDGNLYTCGEGENGKLGLPDSITNSSSPKHVLVGEPVKGVACGANHTLALTETGKVFAFGSNFNGQLGLGPEISQSILPTPVVELVDLNIQQVICGENHTAFITDEGQLFMSGEGRHGQLCSEDIDDKMIFTPSRILRFKGYIVEKVACGGCHSMVLAHLNTSEEEDTEHLDNEKELSICKSRLSQATNNNLEVSECCDEISTQVEHGSVQSMDMNGNDEDEEKADGADEDNISDGREERRTESVHDEDEIENIEEIQEDKADSEEDEKDNDDVAVEPEEKKQGRMARFFSAFRRKKNTSAPASACSTNTGMRQKSASWQEPEKKENEDRGGSGVSSSSQTVSEKKSKTCTIL